MTAPDQPAVPGGWLWRPLVAATLGQVVLGIARPTMSYAGLEASGGGFAIGLLAAAFAIIPLFLALPAGTWAGRLRHVGLLPFVSALTMAAGCALAAAATGLPALVCAAMLMGVGNLGVLIGAQTWISRSAPPSRYASGFGWMTAGMALGQTVGPLVAGTALGDDAHEAGIRGAFVIAAGLATALAVVFVTPATRDGSSIDSATRRPALGILRVHGIARFFVVSATVLTAVDVLTAYLPVLGEAAGIPPTTVGLLLAVRGAFSTASRIGLGALTARVPQALLIAVSTAGSAACLLVVGIAPIPAVLFPALAAAGLLLGIGQPLTMTAVAVALPPDERSRGLALRLLGNRVAQTVTPVVAGALTGLGGIAAVFVIQAVALLACAIWESVGSRRAGS